MMETWIDMIGCLAGPISLIAWIPQLQSIWCDRKLRDFNRWTCGVMCVSAGVWSTCGYLTNGWLMCCSNLIASVTLGATLIQATRLHQQNIHAWMTCEFPDED